MQHLLEDYEEQRLKKLKFTRTVAAWAIGLTLFWPIINLIVYFIRFGNLTWRLTLESLYFAPLGFLSALMIFAFLANTHSKQHAGFVIGGFILFTPIAFLAALGSGLVLPPLIGPTIYGIIPLTIGATIGFFTGKFFD